MDAASSSMSMPMDTTATSSMAMAMPSSTTGAMTMDMVFFASTSTPLWSSSFTPSTTGQYSGACIFLIAFAVVFRFLLALRFNFYRVVAAVKQRRSGSLLQPDIIEIKGTPRRWRAREAVMLGTLDAVIAGVSYLLMLAVMTFNVGYFLSTIGGVFLGSVLSSHLSDSVEGH
ncbi:hypothetical protein PISL3812_00202 [Talaromyces islandicus]|uniref:Copper transport protein n=1 Tax=Talaromyces islandicus TaxID=28573 RepID=A0A0U1LKC0_TALIS|nr:hypothetical protein PISL3812_00202 [Talaromyces islandicus]